MPSPNITTIAFRGIEVIPVEVQVNLSSGVSNLHIVGLGDKAVTESRDRVRAALSSIGIALPARRITVNLAPADLPKEGSHYDLAIALVLLAALDIVPTESLYDTLALGEMTLDGRLMRVAGVLPVAKYCVDQNISLICPEENGNEAAWAVTTALRADTDTDVIVTNITAAKWLTDIIGVLREETSLPAPTPEPPKNPLPELPDLKDIRGQRDAQRALAIAAAGGHHMLMYGPPGAGKSLLASRLPSILPPMTIEEALEVSAIHSVSGMLGDNGFITRRPYRDPHHTASVVSLAGGGTRARPGEMTLSHRGVLFLDELPEFSRQTLESLRQPLETGQVTVSRANHHITYPSRFQLIAAMNPCRCGYFGDLDRQCDKTPGCARKYQEKLSGPLLDRFDLRIAVPAIDVLTLARAPGDEDTNNEDTISSAEVRQQVIRARDVQHTRFGTQGLTILMNAHIDAAQINDIIELSEEGRRTITRAVENLDLTARGFHRILRVGRTIADLDESRFIESHHILEALSYRVLTNW
ncbi:MAG: YifB family Mg chelatase-like AAA ATPase [Alphaproteobacteria bacterium]|nr:YifB family Mg chelatase-like AAA ATPase [Alphaproteobacteria bacterium]